MQLSKVWIQIMTLTLDQEKDWESMSKNTIMRKIKISALREIILSNHSENENKTRVTITTSINIVLYFNK